MIYFQVSLCHLLTDKVCPLLFYSCNSVDELVVKPVNQYEIQSATHFKRHAQVYYHAVTSRRHQ